jgi:integrase
VGIGENWTPRELRHSFVSALSDRGMHIEQISRLVGHSSTHVTEEVYLHQRQRWPWAQRRGGKACSISH